MKGPGSGGLPAWGRGELPEPPRFRESNLELVFPTETVGTVGGVLADGRGRVRALWSSISRDVRGGADAFFAGVPIEGALEMVEPLRRGEPFRWRSLGLELGSVSLSDAGERGLPPEAAARLAEHDPERRAVEVVRIAAETPAAGLLQPGDLLLAADGEPVTRYRELERAAQREAVELSVFRDGKRLALRVPTVTLDPIGTRRALLFGGALLQPVPYPVQLQRGVPAEGVYVVGRWYGSPVERHGLRATRRILAVGGVATPDLDAFLAAVSRVPDRGDLQLLAEDLDGKPEVVTLQLDLRYWPTRELRWDGTTWQVSGVQSGYSISTGPLGTN